MTVEQTTGTVADGNAQGSGTSGTTAGGNAGETPEQKIARLEQEKAKLEQEKAQHLAEKTTLEETKRKLEEQQSQGGAADNALDAVRGYYLDLQQRAAVGDREAMFQIATLELNERRMRNMAVETALGQLPAADRDPTRAIMQQRNVDPATAHEIYRANQVGDREKTLVEREKAIEQREEAIKRGVVSTTTREVPATEAKQTSVMSPQDYGDRMRKLIAEGRTDEANKLERDKDRGFIRLTY